MPRRREVPKREILPDPKFGSVDLSKFMNALLASAMRWTSSRFFIAPPRPSLASSSSLANRAAIDFSPRLRADSFNQRIASATRRMVELPREPGSSHHRRGET